MNFSVWSVKTTKFFISKLEMENNRKRPGGFSGEFRCLEEDRFQRSSLAVKGLRCFAIQFENGSEIEKYLSDTNPR